MKLVFLCIFNSIIFFVGYRMLKHNKDKANPDRFKYLYSGAKRIDKDGYNSLKYKPVKIVQKRLFTWILVDLPHLTLWSEKTKEYFPSSPWILKKKWYKKVFRFASFFSKRCWKKRSHKVPFALEYFVNANPVDKLVWKLLEFLFEILMICLFPFANNIFPEFSHKNLKKTTSKKRKKDIQVFGINSRIIFLTSILSQAIKLMQWNIINPPSNNC